jgi:hypothetical protein
MMSNKLQLQNLVQMQPIRPRPIQGLFLGPADAEALAALVMEILKVPAA